ncbi:hypothetical protein SLA2020_052410 [Shorea laevis]
MAKGEVASSEEKKPSCSSDLSFVPENELAELVWENGQIFMQGQSIRVKKFPTSNALRSHSLKSRDEGLGNATKTRTGNFGETNSMLNEIPISVPSGELGLSQDDDMVPWLNYPIDQSLQDEYYSDFLPEISGVTVNQPSALNNFASFDRRNNRNLSIRDSQSGSVHDVSSFEQGNMSKVSEPADAKAVRNRGSTSQFNSLSSDSSPYVKSRVVNRISDSMSNASTQHGICGDSIGVPTSVDGFPITKMQKRDSSPPSSSSGLMNFSHFLRPAAVVKASLQNIAATVNVEKKGSNDKGSAANGRNPAESESTLINSNSGLGKEEFSRCQPTIVSSKVNVKGSEARPAEETLAAEPPPAVRQDDALRTERNHTQLIGECASGGLPDCEKAVESIAASSSVCSGNSAERASDDPPHNLKRKQCDNEESGCPTEDAEEESVEVKKAAPVRPGTGSKRSRAAEVHNLSERRRRDRINEKMRALQELIPNCNKVDKASMLDEAIEYLKTLQLQVQIMSMGAGLYMPQMMLPTGLQHMHVAHMAHYSPMGVGMGMAIGYGMGLPDMNGGSSACPLVQGMAGSNLQPFGLPGQGLPMSMACAPLIPISGGPPLKPGMGLNSSGMPGPLDNLDSTMASSSKDPMQKINSQAIQNIGASSSMNQALSQRQSTNNSFEQPAAVQDSRQASEVTGSVAVGSSNGNEKVPDRS